MRLKYFAISDKVIELISESCRGFAVLEGRVKCPSIQTTWQPKAPAFNRFWNRVYTLAVGPRADRSIICKAVVEGFCGYKFRLTLLVGPKGFYLCRHDSNHISVQINHWGEMNLRDARIKFCDYKSHAKHCIEYPWTGEWE